MIKLSSLTLSKEDYLSYSNILGHSISCLVTDAPFSMPIIKMPRLFCNIEQAYAATDGRSIFINPTRWVPLPKPQRQGIVYHEWLHVGFRHPWRMKNRIHRVWGFGCDFAIDSHIMQDVNPDKMTIARGMLYDPYYNGWNAEKIYEDLLDVSENIEIGDLSDFEQKAKQQQFCDRETAAKLLKLDKKIEEIFSDDLIQAPSDMNDFDKEMLRDTIRSAEQAKKFGKDIPGEYLLNIDVLKRSRTDWAKAFACYWMNVVQATGDRNYYRPKKWGFPFGIIIPTEANVGKINVTFICDVSGSRYVAAAFESYVKELNAMMPHVERLTVITADCVVQEKATISNISEIIGARKKIKFKGGGGTDFRPALQEAAKTMPDLVIYYTDSFGEYGSKAPGGIQNLLWVYANRDFKPPPYGRYLVIGD